MGDNRREIDRLAEMAGHAVSELKGVEVRYRQHSRSWSGLSGVRVYVYWAKVTDCREKKGATPLVWQSARLNVSLLDKESGVLIEGDNDLNKGLRDPHSD